MSTNPLFQTALCPYSIQQSMTLRKLELQNRLETISRVMGEQKDIYVYLANDPFPVDPPSAGGNVVTVPPLLFISPDEFPPHLRISSLNDPKLEQDNYFEEVAEWLYQTFPQIQKKKIGWKDKEAFKLYIRFMQNPDMARRGFNFCMHHETAHIFHNHKTPTAFYMILSVVLAIIMGICASFILAMIHVIFLSITISLLSYHVLNIFHSRSQEKEADSTAIKITRDADGAAYLFQQIQEQQKEIKKRKDVPFYVKWLIISSGDDLTMALTHDLESRRIACIRKEMSQGSMSDCSYYRI